MIIVSPRITLPMDWFLNSELFSVIFSLFFFFKFVTRSIVLNINNSIRLNLGKTDAEKPVNANTGLAISLGSESHVTQHNIINKNPITLLFFCIDL